MKLLSTLWKVIKSIGTFLYSKDDPQLDELPEKEYLDIFEKGRKREEIERSYQKAWEAKNFEIENYWKRANYFWAFQVAAFAGYFAVFSGDIYTDSPQVLYIVICIGAVTSSAWTFINKGSKTWQRHWEIHVDMLENEITGPLYKIVTTQKTFSVSKINEIVSRFVMTIWVVIAVKYFISHLTMKWCGFQNIDMLVVLSTTVTIYFIASMYFGYGRGRFGSRKVRFYSRKFHTDK